MQRTVGRRFLLVLFYRFLIFFFCGSLSRMRQRGMTSPGARTFEYTFLRLEGAHGRIVFQPTAPGRRGRKKDEPANDPEARAIGRALRGFQENRFGVSDEEPDKGTVGLTSTTREKGKTKPSFSRARCPTRRTPISLRGGFHGSSQIASARFQFTPAVR